VPSHLYSFSFAPNPDWSELFSPQPEIRAYLRSTAERFGVLPRVRFGVTLKEADWDDTADRWTVLTSAGSLTCDLLVLGNGPFSEPAYPEIDGLDDFAGPVVHSARWDHDVDLDGKRVAVVGTGASAIQFVPHVQRRASQVYLFQRTPAWVLPHANRRITDRERAAFRRLPALQKALRGGIYFATEAGSIGLTRQPRLTGLIRLAGLAHLRRQVKGQSGSPLRAGLQTVAPVQRLLSCRRSTERGTGHRWDHRGRTVRRGHGRRPAAGGRCHHPGDRVSGH
jgi:cation diffusion facilitator CzcD-associated flavoprotein CzcO